MRSLDLFGLALSALRQQKVRTVLTTLGVVFGSFVLVASLSVRQGVEETVVREYSRIGELRRIEVRPGFRPRSEQVPPEKLELPPGVSAERRERLRDQITRHWREQHRPEARVAVSAERLEQIRGFEHVQSAHPLLAVQTRVFLGDHAEYALTAPATEPDERLRERLIAGTPLPPGDRRSAVVSEFLLYRLGIVTDDAVRAAVGKTIRLEYGEGVAPRFIVSFLRGSDVDLDAGQEALLEKVLERLPGVVDQFDLPPDEKKALRALLRRPKAQPAAAPVVVREELTICGVVRAPTLEKTQRWDWVSQRAEVLLAPETAAALYLRTPRSQEFGFEPVIVQVDHMDHVKEVNERIKALGLNTWALGEMIEREQFIYRLILSAMAVIAGVALLVSALGITNTMTMSVLERVREIGVMKAVGARDGHIQLIFLVEGALLGLVGGALGLVLGWAASFPTDAWVRSTVESGLSLKLEESIFAFPWWLVLGVPLFACLVTTAAALYPARRAARVNPVTALRHD